MAFPGSAAGAWVGPHPFLPELCRARALLKFCGSRRGAFLLRAWCRQRCARRVRCLCRPACRCGAGTSCCAGLLVLKQAWLVPARRRACKVAACFCGRAASKAWDLQPLRLLVWPLGSLHPTGCIVPGTAPCSASSVICLNNILKARAQSVPPRGKQDVWASRGCECRCQQVHSAAQQVCIISEQPAWAGKYRARGAGGRPAHARLESGTACQAAQQHSMP